MQKQVTIEINYVVLFVLSCLCLCDSDKRIPLTYVCLPIILFLIWLAWQDVTTAENNDAEYNPEHWQTPTATDLFPLNTKSSRYSTNENKKDDYTRRFRLINRHRGGIAYNSKRRGAHVQYSPHTPDDFDE